MTVPKSGVLQSIDDEAQVEQWPQVKIWLFRYVCVVAVLAFCNRSLPTSFLPLVLHQNFGQPFVGIGLAMAMYPTAALISSMWATRFVLKSQSVVKVHTYALILMAIATALFASSKEMLYMFGPGPAMCFVVIFRCCQGVTSALYLSSNTTLITRFFTGDVPYVLGMVEVAVGTGSQLGRMLGGVMFDLGGFPCPFLVLAVVQVGWSIVGLTFNDTGSGDQVIHTRPVLLRQDPTTLPWTAFLTKRGSVALFGVAANYFAVGFLDTTLPSHLEENIGPISVSTLSVVVSMRSASYLIFSYIFAQAMHRNIISYERMTTLGAFNALVGLYLMGPISPISSALAFLGDGQVAPLSVRWAVQIMSMVIMPSGLAALFIPSLPLLQSEVRHLGSHATEQVVQLFIAAMSLGEAIGPILGGLLVARLGFPWASFFMGAPLIAVLIGSLVTYDREVVEARSEGRRGALLERENGFPSPQLERARTQMGFWPGDIVDGESAFQWRRLPFAMEQEYGPPGSAPAITWRRTYSPVVSRQKPWATAPSSSFRRSYSKERPSLQPPEARRPSKESLTTSK
mmetsp:Transcript_15458/g.54159  ORF Transcript_15458/g.54159 Transcript_15458/m.54159 type:complete len:569 (-) Transcript_15458:17-1723(-)